MRYARIAATILIPTAVGFFAIPFGAIPGFMLGAAIATVEEWERRKSV
jgi:hypothetical protein